MPFINSSNLTTAIYEYDRGDKIVKADPAIIWRKLNMGTHKIGETWDSLMKKWNDTIAAKGDTEDETNMKFSNWLELEPKIETIARSAFNIKEIDDDGIGGTVALVISTLSDFLSEREKKSESTETSPSSLPHMDGVHPDLSKEFSGLIG